ncbi:hypothetical protein F5X98DRAFT_364716 [Xylaria grammica]|nr:hypothetical protein F5X98DRAFT_364716 [Xylaria grammica]
MTILRHIEKRRMSDGDGEVRPSHISLPKYAPFPPYDSPDLYMSRYKPRELLNFAAKAFHSRNDNDLSIEQLKARTEFVKAFNNLRKKNGKSIEHKQVASIQRDMGYLMNCLDKFFFFGCLRSHVKLEATMSTMFEKDPSTGKRWESDTTLSIEDDKLFVKVRLNLGQNKPYNLQTLLGRLMHEIVHAWYLYFSCTCEYCERDLLNTTGHPSDQHGPLYLMLHRLLVTEIRRWDATLEDFLADDCPGGKVSRSAKKSFYYFMADLGKDEKEKYNRLRSYNFGAQLFVRLTDDGKVKVRPELKHKQLNMEDTLRGRSLREKELMEDEENYLKPEEENYEDKYPEIEEGNYADKYPEIEEEMSEAKYLIDEEEMSEDLEKGLKRARKQSCDSPPNLATDDEEV